MTQGSSISGMNSTTRPVPGASASARRAALLLAEKFPLQRVRHKPLSILRQEARRALDPLFELEFPSLAKAEREAKIEEILAESPGFSPLEELFRDESIKEFLVLGPQQIIARKGENWLPTSQRFRDAAQAASCARRYLEGSDGLQSSTNLTAGQDVRLSNGFRMLSIAPPDVMGVPPVFLFVRPMGTSAIPTAATQRPIDSSASDGASSIVSLSATVRTPASASNRSQMSGTGLGAMPESTDPNYKLRQRVTERIVRKCASAGVFDLTVFPKHELQKIVYAHVDEVLAEQSQILPEQMRGILALEILTNIRG